MPPSRNKIDSILQMNEFQSPQKNIVSTSGTKSQMTLVYLKNISLLLSMVFAARGQNLDLHLQAEREILKLMHAHDHVHYSRYNTFQQVFLLVGANGETIVHFVLKA